MRIDARKLFGFTSCSCVLEVQGIINHTKIQNNELGMGYHIVGPKLGVCFPFYGKNEQELIKLACRYKLYVWRVRSLLYPIAAAPQ